MGPPTSLLVGVACEFKDMDQPEPESEQKCSLRGGVAVPSVRSSERVISNINYIPGQLAADVYGSPSPG